MGKHGINIQNERSTRLLKFATRQSEDNEHLLQQERARKMNMNQPQWTNQE